MRRVRSYTTLFILAALLAAAASGACGTRPAPASPPHADRAPHAVGLEVAWWVVRDPDGEHVGRVLAAHAGAHVPAPPSQVLRWWSAGLRLVRVSHADLDSLGDALRVAPPLRQSRVGLMPRWSVLAAGFPWSGWRMLRIDGEEVHLPPGRLRLLARTWLAPAAADDGARLRIDLVPQHVPDAPPDDLDAIRRRLGLTPRLDTSQEGPCLTRLTLELELSDGEVVLLVPDHPAHVWRGWNAPPTPAPSRDDLGPFAPPAPDLGGLLLTDWSNPAGVSVRVIVVLRASTPPRFELLTDG